MSLGPSLISQETLDSYIRGVNSNKDYDHNDRFRFECFLRSISIRGKEIRNANFQDLNLMGLDFSETTIINSTFKNARLDGADFSNAKIIDSVFDYASLKRAILLGAQVFGSTTFQHAIFDRFSNVEGICFGGLVAALWCFRNAVGLSELLVDEHQYVIRHEIDRQRKESEIARLEKCS